MQKEPTNRHHPASCETCHGEGVYPLGTPEWEEKFDRQFHTPNAAIAWGDMTDIKDFIKETLHTEREKAVAEWIKKNNPIILFTCSVHEHPIADCFQCHEEQLKDAKATKRPMFPI